MTDPAGRVPLGRTALRLSRLGLGTTALAGMFRGASDEEAQHTLDSAWDAGLRYFDTAPQYGGGVAERRLGAALRGRERDDYVVSSKVGKLIREAASGSAGIFADAPPHEIEYDYSYDGVMRSLEATLRRTLLDRIDVLLIHDVNRKYHGDAVMERLQQTLAGACVALRRLREQGVIGAFGPAGNELDVNLRFLREADIDCIMLPQRWTPLDRSAGQELLPLCAARGVGVLAAAPFASGVLATGPVPGAMYNYAPAGPEVLELVGRFAACCAAFGIPLAAAALQFPLRHPAVASVVTSMRSPVEVAHNLELMRWPIPDALWAALDRDM